MRLSHSRSRRSQGRGQGTRRTCGRRLAALAGGAKDRQGHGREGEWRFPRDRVRGQRVSVCWGQGSVSRDQEVVRRLVPPPAPLVGRA